MSDATAIHDAYKRGELEALKAALGDPPDFPNSRGPRGVGEIILEYAIYHSPLPFIQTLLDLGADPNAKTNIDDYATPLKEAENLGRFNSIEALRKFMSG